jgi:hypothetical protein
MRIKQLKHENKTGCLQKAGKCTGGLMARQVFIAKCPVNYALTFDIHYPKK